MTKLKIKLGDETWKIVSPRAALLMNINQSTREELLKELHMCKTPKLIIIDGVDGVGKTTIVENIIKKLESKGDKVVYNKFKRRRSDNGNFKIPTKEYEWIFRKEVVQEINRRMITYNDEDWIIIDKSPYSEYFYQRVKGFDRGFITPYGNHLMEQEIFNFKEIIDNAIVIFLENDECWSNYYNRETRKGNEGHHTSYQTLNEKVYLSMVKSFKENQHIYENTKRYRNIKIKNDSESWKKVYKVIKQLAQEYE
jgi:thymidylate kinase